MLLDRGQGRVRVLMGKRDRKHAFMPDVYVFPGGRRDRADMFRAFATDLHPDVLRRLMEGNQGDAARRRARGLAIAAIRELQEETGLVIGGKDAHSHTSIASLSCLRYVARAITPPGNIRRFDTRFFLAFTDEAGLDPAQIRDSDELQDVRWLDIEDISGLNMPSITQTIFEHVKMQMKLDPSLPFGSSGPFYFARRGRFHCGII
ncbi:NUDIX hydrolase [Rhizobium sp. CG5]|uniref:NUDIX hydrolase n=1 Tax=Rhizobium sp. CG5 TaxID=2726076 RepID=UPI0020349007